MALFEGEARGEILIDGIPDDIVARLERRVMEQRWLGVDAVSTYRILAREEPALGYRDGPRRASSIRVQLVTSARLSAILEDVELDFAEQRRVRYHARYPHASKGSFVLGGAAGGVIGVLAIVVAARVSELGAFLGIIGVVLAVFITFFSISDTKESVRRTIERILREEIAASRNDARLLAELGKGLATAATATAEAVLSVLSARGLEINADVRARVLETTDRTVLDDWLAKAATATLVSDVLGAADEEEEDEPVSTRERRGSG